MLLRATSNSKDYWCWHLLFKLRGDLVGATGYCEVRSFFCELRMSCYYYGRLKLCFLTEPLSCLSSMVMEGFKKSSFPINPLEVIGEKFYLNSF